VGETCGRGHGEEPGIPSSGNAAARARGVDRSKIGETSRKEGAGFAIVERGQLGLLDAHNHRRGERESVSDRGALIVIPKATGIPGDDQNFFEAVSIH
jgi:hypothetical protein